MNYKNMTLAIAAIVASLALTAVAFTIPQQALAHKSHNYGIKVDQQIDQLNACNNTAVCLNNANDTADISR